MNKNKKTNIQNIIYVRSSKEDINDFFEDIKKQFISCKNYCEENGLKEAMIVSHRQENIKDLLNIITNNRKTNLIVYSIDRITRNQESFNKLKILEKEKLISIKESKDDTSSITPAMEIMYSKVYRGVYGGVYRERLSESIKRGIAHKKLLQQNKNYEK